MKTELNIIREILLNPSQYNLTTPIAHLATRGPYFNAYSDACLEVTGAQIPTLKVWWCVEWPTTIKSLTLEKLRVLRRCLLTSKLISINLLNFVADYYLCCSYCLLLLRFKYYFASLPALANLDRQYICKVLDKKSSTKIKKERRFNAYYVVL